MIITRSSHLSFQVLPLWVVCLEFVTMTLDVEP